MAEGSDYSQYHHIPLYTTDLVTHVANGTYLCRVWSSLKGLVNENNKFEPSSIVSEPF